MYIQTTETLNPELTYYKECRLGVDDPMDWTGQFGDSTSFIGKLKPVTGNGTGALYKFEMDKVIRGARESSIFCLDSKNKTDRILMERALAHDYAIDYQEVAYGEK